MFKDGEIYQHVLNFLSSVGGRYSAVRWSTSSRRGEVGVWVKKLSVLQERETNLIAEALQRQRQKQDKEQDKNISISASAG